MRYIFSLLAYSFCSYCFANEVVDITETDAKSQLEVIDVIAPRELFSYSNNSHSSIENIDKEHLTPNQLNLANWLVSLPGVGYSGQGGLFQSYNIRGFSRSRIRTEIDGIPIFTDRQAGNSISFISPDLLSYANVIKGPSSTLYGNEALGGVVNLSSEIDEGSEINLGLKMPSDGINFSVKNRADKISSAFAYRKEGQQNAENNRPLNTEYEQASGLLRYQGALGNMSANISWMPSVGKDIGKSNISFPEKETASYPREEHSLTQVELKVTDSWLTKFYHHYQNWDARIDRQNSFSNQTSYQSHTLGSLALISHDLIADGGRIGVEWIARKGVKINDIEYIANSNLPISNTLVDGEQDNFALFIDNNWQTEGTNLNLGLRYDWITQSNEGFSNRQDEQLNASLTLQNNWNNAVQSNIEIATGFRFPTLSELYFSGETPRGSILGNKNLEAEQSIGLQLGLKFSLLPSLKLDVSSYYYQMDDYIERYSISDQLKSYRNIESANIYGAEVQLQWQQNNFIDHNLSYQKQIGETKSEQVLEGLLPEQYSVKSSFDIEKIRIYNQLIYQPKLTRIAPNELTRQSYILWNIGSQFQLNEQCTLHLAINNIINENYYTSGDDKSPLQQERNISFSSKWRF